jgi:small conductance mechanosensitive channel
MEDLWLKVQEWGTFYGIKIIAALVILIVGRWIARMVKGLIARILNTKKVDPTIVSFIEHLSYIALLTFIVIAALAQLGIQTTSFIAVIGAAGLAIGLALQGSLANFAAGFLMIIFKPFKAGDYIEGGGTAGVVEKIEVFTTTLNSVDNKVIIIPNAKMMGDIITNYSAKQTRRVDLDFTVGYGNEIEKVRVCLQDVVKSDSRILTSPETVVLVKELKEVSMVFQLRSWVKGTDYWDVYFDLIEGVKKHFTSQGISMPVPQQNVHVYDHGVGQPTPSGSEKANK